MRWRAMISVALLVAGCGSTKYTETAEAIRLESGPGGHANSVLERYEQFRESGKRLVIDGPMISADAFAAFSAPNACYTERAVFSPHALSHYGMRAMPLETLKIASGLPRGLRDWFVGSRWFYETTSYPRIGYDRLRQLWPEGECPREDVRQIARAG